MTDFDSSKATCGSRSTCSGPSSNFTPCLGHDLVSAFNSTYSAPDPSQYSNLVELGYHPTVPRIPWYCNMILDAACMYGNTSLAAQFGWSYERTCEFWRENNPLSEDDRRATVMNKRFRVVGIDGNAAAINYCRSMNIIDEGIVQKFEDPTSEATKNALNISDVWIMQQCMSYMPVDTMKEWIAAFLQDPSRPKRFIYDCNPYFDKRDMSPQALFGDCHSHWEVEEEKVYGYRKKTEQEFLDNNVNGHEMCVFHYVVDFNPENVASKL